MNSNVTEVMYEYVKQLDVASVCYEAIRQFYKTKGTKDTPVSWDNTPAYVRASMVKMVDDYREAMDTSDVTLEQIHDKRVETRIKEGWTYGSVYDAEKQTDPNMCSYTKLPQNFKTAVAIICALIKVLTDPELQLEQDKETI